MSDVRRLSKLAARCAGLLVLVATSAWAQKEELWLDSQTNTPIRSEQVLKRGKLYRVTMQGTYSAWTFNAPGTKSGKPEPKPMWPSPKGTNTLVGVDPEFMFAWPLGTYMDSLPEPAPRRSGYIEVSLDGGKTWKHPATTASFNATDHKYTYELTGDDNALQVRIVDSPYADNYGRVQISVQAAEEELWLDARSNTPIRSEMVLARGKPYRVTMQGTYSAWNFPKTGAKSGKPEPTPMFNSPKGANKLVGVDPEFVFAWPPGSGLEKSKEPAPLRNGSIQFSLDGGKTWKHPASTASFNEKDHKYTYELAGDDNALQVRIVDSPYADNYGRVQILVQPGA
ncbi:hypothetical protein F0U61_07920 [Archangium violaceum]|uniref:hypothetical protein n=1 Tax=Archangium violaceum TaxID=83451 RepID=UPI002B291F65|nr:hypothetical protein F0U61_07920 [Archangium violaceum]